MVVCYGIPLTLMRSAVKAPFKLSNLHMEIDSTAVVSWPSITGERRSVMV